MSGTATSEHTQPASHHCPRWPPSPCRGRHPLLLQWPCERLYCSLDFHLLRSVLTQEPEQKAFTSQVWSIFHFCSESSKNVPAQRKSRLTGAARPSLPAPASALTPPTHPQPVTLLPLGLCTYCSCCPSTLSLRPISMAPTPHFPQSLLSPHLTGGVFSDNTMLKDDPHLHTLPPLLSFPELVI